MGNNQNQFFAKDTEVGTLFQGVGEEVVRYVARVRDMVATLEII
jgi:hypothetical protein